MKTLRSKLAEMVPAMREQVKAVLAEHGDKKISDVSVSQAYGGMRGVKCMITETSALDPNEGIRFRGYSIPEVQESSHARRAASSHFPKGCSISS